MDEFVREVNEILTDLDLNITYKKVWKNNMTLIGFTDTQNKVSPVYYVDESIIDEDPLKVANDIVDFMRAHKDDIKIDMDLIASWDYAKDNVYPKVISEENIPSLKEEDICYDTFLDMAIVYYVTLPPTEEGTVASYTLHQSHLELFDISQGDLRYYARKNVLSEWEMLRIEDIIPYDLIGGYDSNIYILTNKSKHNGAGVIVNDDLLFDIYEKFGDDLIVLPSSIHEVLLIPVVTGMDADYLKEIVSEVNSTIVDPSEKLTDSVYIYDGTLRRL